MKFIYVGAGVSMIWGTVVDPKFYSGRPQLLDVVAALIAAAPFGWIAGILLAGSTRHKIIKYNGNPWAIIMMPHFDFREVLWVPCFSAAFGTTVALRGALGGPEGHRLWPLHDGAMVSCGIVFCCAMAWRYDRWYKSLPDAHTTES